MISRPTQLPGVVVFEPVVHRDSRGHLLEVHRAGGAGYLDLPAFVQDNVSWSREGVVRGLHLQHPGGQGKLVTVLRGEVLDVVVDVRRDSATFGRWTSWRLSAENAHQIYVPEGFAHGFAVIGSEALVLYKCTVAYDPGAQVRIRWDDPDLAITWPSKTPVLSPADAAAPRLRDLSAEALPS